MAGTLNQTSVQTSNDQCLESISETMVMDRTNTTTSLQTIISLMEGLRSDIKQIHNSQIELIIQVNKIENKHIVFDKGWNSCQLAIQHVYGNQETISEELTHVTN